MSSNLRHRSFWYTGAPKPELFEAFRQHMAPLFTVERPDDMRASCEAAGDAIMVGDLW